MLAGRASTDQLLGDIIVALGEPAHFESIIPLETTKEFVHTLCL